MRHTSRLSSQLLWQRLCPLLLTVAMACWWSASAVSATELTFELQDNEEQCFHEEIPADTKSRFMFQVVTGGNYDVDCVIKGPHKNIIAKFEKESHSEHDFSSASAGGAGVYTVCFSNEFSSFTHKLVYFDWEVGDEEPLPGVGSHATALTQMEMSSQTVHESLNAVEDHQTDYRLREAMGRKRAEDLNSRVFYWSLGETLAVLCVGLGQVLIVKNFFAERKTLRISGHGPPYTSF